MLPKAHTAKPIIAAASSGKEMAILEPIHAPARTDTAAMRQLTGRMIRIYPTDYSIYITAKVNYY